MRSSSFSRKDNKAENSRSHAPSHPSIPAHLLTFLINDLIPAAQHALQDLTNRANFDRLFQEFTLQLEQFDPDGQHISSMNAFTNPLIINGLFQFYMGRYLALNSVVKTIAEAICPEESKEGLRKTLHELLCISQDKLSEDKTPSNLVEIHANFWPKLSSKEISDYKNCMFAKETNDDARKQNATLYYFYAQFIVAQANAYPLAYEAALQYFSFAIEVLKTTEKDPAKKALGQFVFFPEVEAAIAQITKERITLLVDYSQILITQADKFVGRTGSTIEENCTLLEKAMSYLSQCRAPGMATSPKVENAENNWSQSVNSTLKNFNNIQCQRLVAAMGNFATFSPEEERTLVYLKLQKSFNRSEFLQHAIIMAVNPFKKSTSANDEKYAPNTSRLIFQQIRALVTEACKEEEDYKVPHGKRRYKLWQKFTQKPTADHTIQLAGFYQGSLNGDEKDSTQQRDTNWTIASKLYEWVAEDLTPDGKPKDRVAAQLRLAHMHTTGGSGLSITPNADKYPILLILQNVNPELRRKGFNYLADYYSNRLLNYANPPAKGDNPTLSNYKIITETWSLLLKQINNTVIKNMASIEGLIQSLKNDYKRNNNSTAIATIETACKYLQEDITERFKDQNIQELEATVLRQKQEIQELEEKLKAAQHALEEERQAAARHISASERMKTLDFLDSKLASIQLSPIRPMPAGEDAVNISLNGSIEIIDDYQVVSGAQHEGENNFPTGDLQEEQKSAHIQTEQTQETVKPVVTDAKTTLAESVKAAQSIADIKPVTAATLLTHKNSAEQKTSTLDDEKTKSSTHSTLWHSASSWKKPITIAAGLGTLLELTTGACLIAGVLTGPLGWSLLGAGAFILVCSLIKTLYHGYKTRAENNSSLPNSKDNTTHEMTPTLSVR